MKHPNQLHWNLFVFCCELNLCLKKQCKTSNQGFGGLCPPQVYYLKKQLDDYI